MSNYIPLGFDGDFFQSGVKAALNWDYTALPHVLVFGSTGSGKTYCSKILLSRIGLKIPNAFVTLCDFKNDAFEDMPNYYGFMDCKSGIDIFLKCSRLGKWAVIHAEILGYCFLTNFRHF